MIANSIVRIVIYTLVILVLLGILLAGIFAGKFFTNISLETSGGNVASVGSVPADEIQKLKVEWVAFSETEDVSEKQKMVWKQSGDTLTLQFCQSNSFLGINFGFNSNISKDLVITIPEDWVASEVSIDSVSARINISDLETTELNLTNVSGYCVIANCVASNVDVETVSGEIDYTGTLSALDLESVSADCTLTLTTGARDISMECVSGDLTLYLPENQGFTAKVDGLSGDITTDFATTVSGGTHTYGDGSCRINASGVSGNINIRKAAHVHTWNEGTVQDIPGESRQEMVYTCTGCGETKSEPVE